MPEAHTRIVASRAVYRGRVLSLNVDQIVLPNGHQAAMEVVRHGGSVVLLVTPAPGRILLTRQYRYAVDRWLWEVPAGGIEPGETAEAAARRECQEEVGKIAGAAELLGTLLPTPGYCDETMTFFRLRGVRDPLATDPVAEPDLDEVLEVSEFSVDEARRMVRDGVIVDLKTAFGLSLLA